MYRSKYLLDYFLVFVSTYFMFVWTALLRTDLASNKRILHQQQQRPQQIQIPANNMRESSPQLQASRALPNRSQRQQEVPLSPQEIDEVERRLEESMIVSSPSTGGSKSFKQPRLSQQASQPNQAAVGSRDGSAFARSPQSHSTPVRRELSDPTYSTIGDQSGMCSTQTAMYVCVLLPNTVCTFQYGNFTTFSSLEIGFSSLQITFSAKNKLHFLEILMFWFTKVRLFQVC